jgi:hypothetical protein
VTAIQAVQRLGVFRLLVALGPACYGKVLPAQLPGVGVPNREPIGDRS